MKRRAIGSSCRDPENRSDKTCACGRHSTKARKKRKRWTRDVPPVALTPLHTQAG